MSRSWLFSLPLLILAGAAYATPGDTAAAGHDGLSAPAEAQAVGGPAPCAGCAGHDCANCPMAQAAAAESAASGGAPIRCSLP